MHTTSKLLSPREFLYDLEFTAKKAKKRVWVQAMYFLPGEAGHFISKILVNSAKKGLDSRLQFDCISLMDTDPKINPISKSLIKVDSTPLPAKQRHLNKKNLIKSMKRAGVKVRVLNKPNFVERLLPLKGRNHIKLSIVDDVAYIGGLNFGPKDLDNIDFMVKYYDTELVRTLASIYTKIYNNSLKEDLFFSFSKHKELWIDSGKPNKSLILHNTLKQVSKAKKSIVYTGQLPPDGKYLNALSKAQKRGVKITIFIPKKPDFNLVSSFLNFLSLSYMQFKNNKFKIIKTPIMLHSKVTLIDDKILIFGSHNFSKSGVMLGTAELSFKTYNRSLIKQVKKFLFKYDKI